MKVRALQELLLIPGIGKSLALDLYDLGIRSIKEMGTKNPEALYQNLCKKRGRHIDRCVLYVFRCAVYYASRKKHSPELLKWWNWKDGNLRDQKELIAPCGMDCSICSSYLAYSHNFPKRKGRPQCIGCRVRNRPCAFIRRDCELLKQNKITFCFECSRFPCRNLKYLDKRYIDSYGMSFVGNLIYIKANGLAKFIFGQKRKYKCPQCGDTLCIHNNKCYTCDRLLLEKPGRPSGSAG